MPSLHLYIIEKVEKSKSRCQFPKSMKKVDAGSQRTLTTSIFPVPEVDEKRQCRIPKSMPVCLYLFSYMLYPSSKKVITPVPYELIEKFQCLKL